LWNFFHNLPGVGASARKLSLPIVGLLIIKRPQPCRNDCALSGIKLLGVQILRRDEGQDKVRINVLNLKE
jgi:hypothetical protein